MKIYLSAPLFTQAQRKWNRMLAGAIEERIVGAQVMLPQDLEFSGVYNRSSDFPKIFRACVDLLEEADLMVAVLDGPDVDSGTAFEVGFAHARGMPIIGIRTDFRESQDRGLNVMLAQACTELLQAMSFSEDLPQLVKHLAGKIVNALHTIAPPGSPGTGA